MSATLARTLSLLLLAGCAVAGPVLAAPAAADAGAAHPLHKPKAAFEGVETDVHANPVGKGTHMGLHPTAPGVYFNDHHRRAVHAWFQSHPPAGAQSVQWTIGQPLPAGTPVKPVTGGLLGALPKQPRGYHYVEAGGNVLLVASGSKMVVDGINGLAQ